MKLTKEQKEIIPDEVIDMLMENMNYAVDNACEICDKIINDVYEDIENTADWSGIDADEVCLGDIHLAIGRVIKKHLTKKKVFLLITQWSVDYEQGSDSGIYATKELARKEMERDYKNMCEEYPDWVGSIDDDCAEMQEEGDYTRNHCDWQIKEIEVISE